MTRFTPLLIVVVLLAALALPAHAQDGGELPGEVLAARPGFHPEGIEWLAEGGTFLTGSLAEGTIFAVADDGTVTPFIEDPDLVASIGIHIDHATNRLLVANSSRDALSGGPGMAMLGAYDLETGERLFMADLGALLPEGRHFANDVVNDPDGNAYVTDSMSPAIYKVDPEGNAEIFLQSETFESENFGLNGIEYHPDGFLLVALAGTGQVFRVPLDDPGAFAPVELPEPAGIDGMTWHPGGDLVAVATLFDDAGQGNRDAIALRSADGWQSATIVERVELDDALSPTTVAVRDGAVYAVHAHFNTMGSDTPTEEFEILHVGFAQLAEAESDAMGASGAADDSGGTDEENLADLY